MYWYKKKFFVTESIIWSKNDGICTYYTFTYRGTHIKCNCGTRRCWCKTQFYAPQRWKVVAPDTDFLGGRNSQWKKQLIVVVKLAFSCAFYIGCNFLFCFYKTCHREFKFRLSGLVLMVRWWFGKEFNKIISMFR